MYLYYNIFIFNILLHIPRHSHHYLQQYVQYYIPLLECEDRLALEGETAMLLSSEVDTTLPEYDASSRRSVHSSPNIKNTPGRRRRRRRRRIRRRRRRMGDMEFCWKKNKKFRTQQPGP